MTYFFTDSPNESFGRADLSPAPLALPRMSFCCCFCDDCSVSTQIITLLVPLSLLYQRH